MVSYRAAKAQILSQYFLVHVHIPLRAPTFGLPHSAGWQPPTSGRRDHPESCPNSGSAAYFTVQTLKRIVRPNVPLVGHGEIIIRKNGSRWHSRIWLQARIRFELHRLKSVSAIFHPQKCTGISAQVVDYAMLQPAQKSSDSGADPATQKSLGNVT